jgi:hypothetical protein
MGTIQLLWQYFEAGAIFFCSNKFPYQRISSLMGSKYCGQTDSLAVESPLAVVMAISCMGCLKQQALLQGRQI